jgi:hypothetical protein
MVAKSFNHKFQSGVADDPDATRVRTQANWDGDAHDLRLGGRQVTTGLDTIVAADELSLIKYNSASAQSITLSNPDAINIPQGWTAFVRNVNAGLAIISSGAGVQIGFGTTGTLNLRQAEDLILISDGVAWDALWSSGSIFARAGQIPGTATNDDAAAGNMGQAPVVSVSQGSGPALVTDTANTVASMALSAGDWDVDGEIGFNGSAATNYLIGCILTSGTVQAGPGAAWETCFGLNPFNYLSSLILPLGTVRFSFPATTTVYLNAMAGFTPGAISAYGNMRARRVR